MNIARRGFLRALPALGIGARTAAKATVEEVAAKLSGLSVGYGSGMVPAQALSSNSDTEDWKRALSSSLFRSQVESLLYQNNRHVGHIDHDLAILRSVSLSAKITFQRQRNVERELTTLQDGYSWDRLRTALTKHLGIIG